MDLCLPVKRVTANPNIIFHQFCCPPSRPQAGTWYSCALSSRWSLHSSLYCKKFHYFVGPEKYRMVEESKVLPQSLFQFDNTSCAMAFFGSITPDVNRDKSTHGLGASAVLQYTALFPPLHVCLHSHFATNQEILLNLTPELFYFFYLKEIPVPT